MSPLTLQEVIDRINQAHSRVQDLRANERPARENQNVDQKHRPEFYLPRLTRRLAKLVFSA